MRRMDLNADLGEIDTPDGHASDAAILSVVSSASIACGGHAGDESTMRRAVRKALEHGVRIGAHPAYPDREGFGRTPGFAIDRTKLADSVSRQVRDLMRIAAQEGGEVAYVKPHGALYNDAVHDTELAELVISAVEDIDPGLTLMGAPNSELQDRAEARLRFEAEGFIDRAYADDGHLVPRSRNGAVLATNEERMAQLIDIAVGRSVTTVSGTTLMLVCRTLCVHGDSPGAMETAKLARAKLFSLGFDVAAGTLI